jgi:Patatin-like phospholipase
MSLILGRFVCAVPKHENENVIFRTYKVDNQTSPFEDCKIWEAARATSAAPFYFPSARVPEARKAEGRKFWDGGLSMNNPVQKVWDERTNAFNGEPPVACMISLGTGSCEKKPTRSFLPLIGTVKLFLQKLTDVQKVHKDFEENDGRDQAYYRFDPTIGGDEIGLADYKKLDALTMYTQRYLDEPDVKENILACARRLARTQDGNTITKVTTAGIAAAVDNIPDNVSNTNDLGRWRRTARTIDSWLTR